MIYKATVKWIRSNHWVQPFTFGFAPVALLIIIVSLFGVDVSKRSKDVGGGIVLTMVFVTFFAILPLYSHWKQERAIDSRRIIAAASFLFITLATSWFIAYKGLWGLIDYGSNPIQIGRFKANWFGAVYTIFILAFLFFGWRSGGRRVLAMFAALWVSELAAFFGTYQISEWTAQLGKYGIEWLVVPYFIYLLQIESPHDKKMRMVEHEKSLALDEIKQLAVKLEDTQQKIRHFIGDSNK